MAIHDILSHIGLNGKEISIYLALLELGETTILQAATKSGIKRPTAYLVLHALEEKGFVSRRIHGKKIYFSPQHPQKLTTEADFRLKELKEIMPQLESLFHRDAGQPRIMIYEGKDKLDRAYDDWFVVKGELMYIGTLTLSTDVFPRTYKKMGYINSSPEFQIRELIDENGENRIYAKRVTGFHRNIRFIPKELLPFEVDIGIFGNRVLITSVKKEYFTISIQSDEIARAFRSLFEVMWSRGTE